MSRGRPPSILVQRTVNGMLALLEGQPLGDPIASEVDFAKRLGVSRSPVRTALRILARRGVLRRMDHGVLLHRHPQASDRFPADDSALSKSENFERYFLGKIHRRELHAGERFSELELAREAQLATITVREGLLRYARFGLIHKEPRRQWRVVDFDDAMIDELFDLRELLERAVLEKALALPADHPLRSELATILLEHRRFAAGTPAAVERFLALDDRFHRTLFQAAANRYLDAMYAMVSILIHFQLRCGDPVGERGMTLGLSEHPPVIEAILANDAAGAHTALGRHLASARMVMKLAAAHGRTATP